MADWSNRRMRWWDAGDRAAWPIALVAVVVVALVLWASGVGWWALVVAAAVGAATHNLTAARARKRSRARSGP